MSDTTGAAEIHDLATWAVEVQREHAQSVRRASLSLAVQDIIESG